MFLSTSSSVRPRVCVWLTWCRSAYKRAKLTIGIVMDTAGTGIVIESADIALMADDLMTISQAIALSKSTRRTIRQNVVIALLTVSLLLADVLLSQMHMASVMLVD